MLNRLLKQALLPIAFTFVIAAPAFAQPVSASEAKAAMDLYSQKQYAKAADAFEKIIARQPCASYCYYAALAARGARRETRARQLFDYVVHNFPTTTEASYAKQAIGNSPAPPSSSPAVAESTSDDTDLPDSVKALIPPSMQSMMNTPEGRRAVADAMRQNSDKLATIRKAESNGAITTKSVVASAAVPELSTKFAGAQQMGSGTKEYPFTPADIARQGARAIDQMRYPNCWFECSMASLAELPRGQKLIASMIRGRGEGKYVVKFPGDGNDYAITLDDLRQQGIHDSGLWASLIEAAQTRKFPDNKGANGADDDMSRLEIGLGCITGCKAEVLTNLKDYSEGQLSSFIGGAVKSQNPVVCSTYHAFPGLPYIAVPLHAYTVIGFDPSRNMIVIRNPHGRNSDRFSLDSDPKHIDFEQMDDGVFKMSIRTFQKYFYSVARSFI